MVLGLRIHPSNTTVIRMMNTALTEREAELAAKWARFQGTSESSPEYHDLAEASVYLNRLMFRDRDSFWRIVCAICDMNEDEWIQANIAAGPLENYLSCYGESAVKQVADAAARSDRFRSALDGIWRNQMSEETWSALQLLRTDRKRSRSGS